MDSRWFASALGLACTFAIACKKQEAEKKIVSPTLPKEQRAYIWLEQFPNCPGGNQNMLAHHIKIKVDEGERVTTAHFVRAPVKTYEGLNLIVINKPHKAEITYGQCNARSDDPKFRCEDDAEITWYATTSIDIDPTKHQVVPFTPPPKMDCVQGGPATLISLVAQRPGSGSDAKPGSGSSGSGSGGSAGSGSAATGSSGSGTPGSASK